MTRKTSPKFHSGIAEAVHETASGLHRIGLIDQKTMREFDASCLTAVEPLTPEEILELRDRAGKGTYHAEDT
jgi:putative transcriptional regulator